MFKLNESRLEIEIESPSILIKRLEDFIIRNKDTQLNKIPKEDKTVIGDFRLSDELRILLVWTPKSDGSKIINY